MLRSSSGSKQMYLPTVICPLLYENDSNMYLRKTSFFTFWSVFWVFVGGFWADPQNESRTRKTSHAAQNESRSRKTSHIWPVAKISSFLGVLDGPCHPASTRGLTQYASRDEDAPSGERLLHYARAPRRFHLGQCKLAGGSHAAKTA